MCVDTLGFLIQPNLRGLGRYSKLTLLVLTHGRKRKRAGYGCRNSNDSRFGSEHDQGRLAPWDQGVFVSTMA